MLRKIAIFSLLPLLTMLVIQAQDQLTGTTGGVTLNIRQRADPVSERIAQLPPNTPIIVEARSEKGDWVLVTAPQPGLRGWVAIGYVSFDRTIRVMEDLPYSSEQVVNAGAIGSAAGPAPQAQVAPADIIPDRIDYPPVFLNDGVWRNIRQIYGRGRQLGNDPWALMKVGESNTAGTVYLCNFEWRSYALGDHSQLQQVVDEFSRTGSFCRNNASAQNGFGTVNVLDPLFALPEFCQPDETPLACEVRRSRPSFAFIHIGLADTGVITAQQYNSNLTQIVRYLSSSGVIPILQTWPTADVFNANNRPQLFNEEIRKVAYANNVPLLDIRAAIYGYENHGTESDGHHLSVRNPTVSDLGDANTYGRPYRELQSLQILYDLIAGLNS